MFSHLLCQIDRAMLSASTAERSRQALKAAALVIADAGVHQRLGIFQVFIHALLLAQIVDHRSVFSGKHLEALFASGIGQTARIEDESSAVAGLVLGRAAAMERETKDSRDKFICRRCRLRR